MEHNRDEVLEGGVDVLLQKSSLIVQLSDVQSQLNDVNINVVARIIASVWFSPVG